MKNQNPKRNICESYLFVQKKKNCNKKNQTKTTATMKYEYDIGAH